MRRIRHARSKSEIARVIRRVEVEELKPVDALTGTEVWVEGRRIKLSAHALIRWAQEGRLGSGRNRIYLDAIKRGDVWVTSVAAIERFVKQLPQVEAPTAA